MRGETRVLCVSAFPDLGGGEISLLDTVTCLATRGLDVEVLNLVDRPGALARALGERHVPVHHCRIGRFRDPRGVVRATRWFARHAGRFDLALANDGRAALYTAAGLALRRRPYVWHVRDLVGAGHALERLAVRLRPAMWIANSEAVRASLVHHGCRAGRVVVVHNGVDVSRFHPGVSGQRFRADAGADDSTVLVGGVARLVPWKGLETLLEAAARLTAPTVRFVVVGDVVTDAANRADAVRYRESLLALRDRLGLADRVCFAGGRRDMPAVMAGLDVLVHTAIEEPFGRVLIEAMAAGTPVVATRGGGVGEIVEDGVSGYLVGPRDADALADRVGRLLADPERRRAMGRAGRERARSRFSLEAYGDGLASVMRTVLSRPVARDGRAAARPA